MIAWLAHLYTASGAVLAFLAALAVISSWSIGGLFISLGPALGATLLHTDNHIVTALGVVTLAGAGAAAQLAFGRCAPWAGTALGSLALATGMVAMVIASSTGTIALYWFGALTGGAGFGVAFLGGLRALSAAIPPQHRAAARQLEQPVPTAQRGAAGADVDRGAVDVHRPGPLRAA